MSDFVKEIHNMFDHIWDCEIDHPVYQDTVGELMEAVIQTYEKHKPTLGTNLAEVGTDAISRQAAIDAMAELQGSTSSKGVLKGISKALKRIEQLPPIQPDNNSEVPNSSDCISRRAAIDAIDVLCQEHRYKIPGKGETYSQYNEAWQDALDRAEGAIGNLPSAEPEHTCVNCGRTANNGGWYADGRTRCPIEEHYALPKDGFCHLWEKRNVTDDDYPERREE